MSLATLAAWLVFTGCGADTADEKAPGQEAARNLRAKVRSYKPLPAGGDEESADGELREALHRLLLALREDDPSRAPRLFDDFLGSDLFMRYGTLKVGAIPATVAYDRYLDDYLKTRKRFLRNTTKTSLIISTGTALRMIARADLDGRAFAISAASLGLSSASVRAGFRGLEEIRDLRAAKKTGVVARYATSTRRFRKFGGVVYRVGEEVLILYFADEVERKFTEYLDLKGRRRALGEAVAGLLDALNDDPEALEAALDAHSSAWDDYRDFLHRSLSAFDEEFEVCVSKVARRAKLVEDWRETAERVNDYPALKSSIEERYGSIDAFAEEHLRDERADIDQGTGRCLATYNSRRDERLRELYEDNRRDSRLLEGIDLSSIRGRMAARVSENRIQAYEDELDILAALAHGIRGLDLEADLIEAELVVVDTMKKLDTNLFIASGVAGSQEP